MDTQQLIAQLMNEGGVAGDNGYALSRLLDPLIIALEDDYPVTQAMIAPVERKLTEMREQVERIQRLLTAMQKGEVTYG
jgi:hypothetical protein